MRTLDSKIIPVSSLSPSISLQKIESISRKHNNDSGVAQLETSQCFAQWVTLILRLALVGLDAHKRYQADNGHKTVTIQKTEQQEDASNSRKDEEEPLEKDKCERQEEEEQQEDEEDEEEEEEDDGEEEEDMGKLFKAHLSGPRVYCCHNCATHLTEHEDIVSTSFHGRCGRAFLFANV